MTFNYNPAFAETHAKKSSISALIALLIIAVFTFISFLPPILKHDNKTFIILLSCLGMLVLITLIVLSGYKKTLKVYKSFNLIITDEFVEIKSDTVNKKIYNYKIESIFIDKEENIYIKQSRFIEVKIMPYIENKAELLYLLNNIKKTESVKKRSHFILLVPTLIIFAIIINNVTIGNIHIFIILALSYIISAIYVSILIILSGNRKSFIIGNLAIFAIFIFLFSIGLLQAIGSLISGF